MALPELVQAFVQAVDTLAVHLERHLELQVGYFIGDHQLEDATAMFLYCAQVDTWAKEAVEPTDQRVGIERAANKANNATDANDAADVRASTAQPASGASTALRASAHSWRGMGVLKGCVPSCDALSTAGKRRWIRSCCVARRASRSGALQRSCRAASRSLSARALSDSGLRRPKGRFELWGVREGLR